MTTAARPTAPTIATQQVQVRQPEPIYFGPGESLFGVFHRAARPRPRAGAVVMCQPVGHEYFRLHRAFRNIAVALSRLGFSVLRFDYYGTGDSHDDASRATLARWQADVAAAIEELKRRSAAPRVSIAGLRLGATIAWLECLGRTDVDLLVMWEPVVSGRAYLEQLRRVEREWLTEPSRQMPADVEMQAGRLLGFPLSAELERDIQTVDLSAGPLPATAHVVTLLAAADSPGQSGWRERMDAAYGAKSSGVLPSGADWIDPAAIHTAVYAPAAVQSLPALFDTVIV